MAKLETLPLLVLESVCEYLSHCDSRRRSLFAFSLTARCCCFAATKQRFERIRFTVLGRKKLRQDLERWNEILGIDARARYVRRVKVIGHMPLVQVDEAGEEREIAPAFRTEMFLEEDEDESDSDEDDFFRPLRALIEEFNGAGPHLTHKEKHKQNEAWLPLAHFLDQLPGLKDLIYGCTNHIPACIISSLHRHHPNSRFHVHTFSLRSLYQPKGRPREIDPAELVLATSPCLYSIVVSYSDYDSDGNVNYNEEAVLQMVAALTPRLEFVRMWRCFPRVTLPSLRAVRTPRPPWQGFLMGKSGESPRLTRSKGHLRSLVLDGGNSTRSAQLTTWSNHTDFSQLYSLEIRQEVPLEALRILIRMAENGEFKSLHTLALFVSPFMYQEQAHMDEAASVLLQALRPLQDLGLTGLVTHSTFTTVLHRHGETLRKLQFIPARGCLMQVEPFVISHHCCQELQKRCPNLREVELPIPGTKGDEQDVSIFRALVTLPRLKRASLLLLDCSHLPDLVNDVDSEPLFDEEKASRMYEALINSDVGSSIALGIFRAISATKIFRYLRLHVSEGGNLRPALVSRDFCIVVGLMSRSWVCKRDPGGEIIVREIGKHDRMEFETTKCLYMDMSGYFYGKLRERMLIEV